SWAWSIGTVTLNGAPAPAGSYSLWINQPAPSSPAATLSGTFSAVGNWSATVTASVNLVDQCGHSWSGSGSASTSVTVFSVQVSASGRFVGAVRDQTPLALSAAPTPGTVSGTYSWTVASGPGSGTFHAPTDQNPGFTGDAEGACSVRATLTAGSASAQGSLPLQVIRVDDLSGTVPEAQYNSYDTSGSYTIPYSTSEGTLQAVLIQPPGTMGYQWQTDFYALVNQQTGDVNVTMISPGPYLVKAVRTGSSGGTSLNDIIQLMFNSWSDPKDKSATGTTARIAAPSGDLILIDSTTPDGAMDAYRQAYPNGTPMGSVQDAIDAINNHWNNNGNQPFSVVLIGHGAPGNQGMGDGQDTVVGKNISDQPASAPSLAAFTAACKGKVSSITMYGCNVAKGASGAAFVQDVATRANCTVTAYTGSVMISK
ncbi:unnamed protein product, partial [Phaeothamnion confervicola]